MKLTLDANPHVTLVRSYSNGELRVGEQVFHRSCILTPDAVLPDWRPTQVEELDERDLEAVFAAKPELVLLGTGDRQRFPSVRIRGAFIRAGIGLETMDLGAACRTFNVLVQEERRVCAALLFGS
ncbi:MAG: Mth938-like domain-containing protein [Gammaproteobacteria bacterium]